MAQLKMLFTLSNPWMVRHVLVGKVRASAQNHA
jgi:hypothetical protein